VKDNREDVKTELEAAVEGPGSVKAPVVTSELGRRWNLLSAQDKMKYENMFQDNQKKYEIARAKYKPSEEFLLKVKLKEEEEKSSGTTPPGMIKAYFDFVARTWMRVATSNPGLSPGEMQRVIWSEWSGEGGEGGVGGKGKKSRKRPKSGTSNVKVNRVESKCKLKEKDVDVSSDPNPSVVDETSPKKIISAVLSPTVLNEVTNSKQQMEEKAFAFFQNQMSEELRRVCPDMGSNDIGKCVKEKWNEISVEKKEIFYRETLQSQNKAV